MKYIILLLTTQMLFFCSLHAQSNSASDITDTLPLDLVIQTVNNSLKEASEDLSGISLESASVTFKTILDVEGGGGFKLFAKASKEWSKETSNSVTYNFAKPSRLKLKSFLQPEFIKLQDDLTEAVINASSQYRNSIAQIDGLQKKDFTVNLAFSVTKNTSGGFDFEIFNIGIDTSGGFGKTVSHSISLKFK